MSSARQESFRPHLDGLRVSCLALCHLIRGSVLMLADVHPAVLGALQRSGALEVIGAENVMGATPRVLAAEETAWDAAQRWLQARRS